MLKPYKEYKEVCGLHGFSQIPSHWRWLFLSQASKEQCVKNITNSEENVLSLSF
jgi:hypothetical protein